MSWSSGVLGADKPRARLHVVSPQAAVPPRWAPLWRRLGGREDPRRSCARAKGRQLRQASLHPLPTSPSAWGHCAITSPFNFTPSTTDQREERAGSIQLDVCVGREEAETRSSGLPILLHLGSVPRPAEEAAADARGSRIITPAVSLTLTLPLLSVCASPRAALVLDAGMECVPC